MTGSNNNCLSKNVVFYDTWLPLDKKYFRVLAWVTHLGGSFHGNLTDLCELMGISSQTKNRNNIKTVIQQLVDQGFLAVKQHRRDLDICLIPKGAEIPLELRGAQAILRHEYHTAHVSPEYVLKTLLWIARNNAQHNTSPVTDQMICEDLNISISTLGLAKNVLSNELHAISRRVIGELNSFGQPRTLGQSLEICAWWYGS